VDTSIAKQTRGDSVYFTIRWSALTLLDKHIVTQRIPSQAGIYELYRDTGGRTPELIGRSRAYYGGLRNTLRGLIDPDTPYAFNGELLDQSRTHWTRYAMTESSDDMDDLLFFFADKEVPQPEQHHSGRYRYVYVKEEPAPAATRTGSSAG
jgi:hypothetical protein